MDLGNFLQTVLAPQPLGRQPWMPQGGNVPAQPPQFPQQNFQDLPQGIGAPQQGNTDDFLQQLFSQQNGGQGPVNVLQQAGIDTTMLQPAPVSQQPQPAQQAPRARRSLIDTIGGIADVLAKVGGADPLYQSTLDARQQFNQNAATTELQQDVLRAQGTKLGDEHQATLRDSAASTLAGIAGQPNAGALWRQYAPAELPAAVREAVAQQLDQNPESAPAIAKIFNGHEGKYAKQVNIAVDPATGKTIAYQVDDSGNVHQVALPEGYNPVDPITAINTGGATNIVGRNTGTIKRILPNTERPGAAADRSLRRYTADLQSRDRRYVADTRGSGSGKGATPADVQAMATTAQDNIDELKKIYGDLDKMGAMVNPKKGTGANIVARGRASIAGQLLEGAAGTQAQTLRDRINSIRPGLMQSLAKATGMTGKQLDSNADVKLFMATVTDPTKSYQANLAAINGLERFLQTATKRNNSAPPRSQNSPKPTRRTSGPTVSNW